MQQQRASAARPDYGIDAPGVVRNLALAGAACLALALVGYLALSSTEPGLAVALLHTGLWPGVGLLSAAAVMLWGSTCGKLRMRDRLLGGLPWRGDEAVLDVGCGRGLLLVGAAKRLATGKAVGIDLWRAEDLSGNQRDQTWANAQAEGVAERVEIQDGDARRLPFADAAFDVVVSSSALHNIEDAAGRSQALREIVRVLRPGGRVAIFDIRHTAEYVRVLGEAGLSD